MQIQQDQAALIRSTVAAILIGANTIAADRVDQERVDTIESGDSPRIIIIADHTANTDSQGGTAVVFQVTLNLSIQMLVEDAALTGVLAKADTLTAQVKNALFCAPAFTMLIQNIASYRVVSAFKQGGDYIQGDVRLMVTATWREIYNPTPGLALSAIGVTTAIGNDDTIVSQFTPGV